VFRNYLTVAFRNIIRQPGYSSINVIGLAIGMTCAVLIASFIYDEYSYTDHHPDSDRIYRVLSVSTDDGGAERITTGVPGGFTLAVKDAIPEIERATRVSRGWGVRIRGDDGLSIGQVMMVVDRDAFDMFELTLLRGDLSDLKNPYAVFVTESSASRLWGDEDPIGKTFSSEGRFSWRGLRRGGCDRGYGSARHVQVDMIKGGMRFWGLNPDDGRGETLAFWEEWESGQAWRPIGSYVKLHEGQDPRVVESKIADLVVARHGAEYAETERFVLQPLNRIYLHSREDFGIINVVGLAGFEAQGDIQFVTVLSLIAFALLMIACVN
jgi:putative ABC transport system permease protein